MGIRIGSPQLLITNVRGVDSLFVNRQPAPAVATCTGAAAAIDTEWAEFLPCQDLRYRLHKTLQPLLSLFTGRDASAFCRKSRGILPPPAPCLTPLQFRLIWINRMETDATAWTVFTFGAAARTISLVIFLPVETKTARHLKSRMLAVTLPNRLPCHAITPDTLSAKKGTLQLFRLALNNKHTFNSLKYKDLHHSAYLCSRSCCSRLQVLSC